MHYSEQKLLQEAREAYANGNPRFDIRKENCALLVIDMQDEFVKPGWTPFWIPEATRQVPKIRELIDCCRSRNIPVIFTVFSATHFFLDRPVAADLMPNRYPRLGSSPEWFRNAKVWHELAPLEQELIICKPSYGAFYDTPLETILKRLQKDTIIICGTLTNYCCGTTARQGYERGFKVVVGSDVCSTDDTAMQEPELKVLRKGFGKVLTGRQIIQELQ